MVWQALLSVSHFEPDDARTCAQIPRFAFEKFPGAKAELTTQMKSVGEAMAFGRTFQESFQKVRRRQRRTPFLQRCWLLQRIGKGVMAAEN